MIFGKTHIGLVRETNEDALFYDEENKVMIIADGIGGHARGEEASNKAIESLRDYIYNNRSRYADKEKLLIDGFKAANTAVHHIQEGLAEGKICGTTLTCAIVDQGILYFAHVGDTRIYVSRDKKDIEQITYDHTYLSELARKDFKTFIEHADLPCEQLSDARHRSGCHRRATGWTFSAEARRLHHHADRRRLPLSQSAGYPAYIKRMHEHSAVYEYGP